MKVGDWDSVSGEDLKKLSVEAQEAFHLRLAAFWGYAQRAGLIGKEISVGAENKLKFRGKP